jgi:hydroxymethylbilane synthase
MRPQRHVAQNQPSDVAHVRIGTRGSLLARAQAEHVASLLTARADATTEIVVVGVSGDEGPPLDGDGARAPQVADKSRWVDRIEEALRKGRIDLAVHSAKDVPSELGEGLELLASPARADARDALIGAGSLHALAPGARVGTSSIRRASQVRALREDLEVVPLRGNVDTRLRRLAAGECDAVVLALAGLQRLAREGEVGARLRLEEFVPAAGQGTLALEGRADDREVHELAAAIGDAHATAALAAERALVAELQADCNTPVGAHALARGSQLELHGYVGLPDGSHWVRDRFAGDARDPLELGRTVARRMAAAGARGILALAQELALAGA